MVRGEGIPQIALEVSKNVKSINFKRAIRIARTEVIRASNSGAMTGANMTGLSLNKEWISTKDERTRGATDEFDHINADGEVVDKDAKFIKTGEPLDYPAHWEASAGNSINCRCAHGYSRK